MVRGDRALIWRGDQKSGSSRISGRAIDGRGLEWGNGRSTPWIVALREGLGARLPTRMTAGTTQHRAARPSGVGNAMGGWGQSNRSLETGAVFPANPRSKPDPPAHACCLITPGASWHHGSSSPGKAQATKSHEGTRSNSRVLSSRSSRASPSIRVGADGFAAILDPFRGFAALPISGRNTDSSPFADPQGRIRTLLRG